MKGKGLSTLLLGLLRPTFPLPFPFPFHSPHTVKIRQNFLPLQTFQTHWECFSILVPLFSYVSVNNQALLARGHLKPLLFRQTFFYSMHLFEMEDHFLLSLKNHLESIKEQVHSASHWETYRY